MSPLGAEVERFKAWAQAYPGRHGEWEVDYEGWPALYEAVDGALAKQELSDEEVEHLLYALARDNECEVVCRKLSEHPGHGLQLARAAMSYPDADARWQTGVFLGTLDNAEARELLRRLIADEEEYVRRRALLASVRFDGEHAERVAFDWLGSPHDYSRLAALSILRDAGSSHLGEALALLRADPLVYIREEVARIEASRAACAG